MNDYLVHLQVYKERVLTVAMNCAQQAAKTGVKRFIHVSTAQVYNSDKVSCDQYRKEDSVLSVCMSVCYCRESVKRRVN